MKEIIFPTTLCSTTIPFEQVKEHKEFPIIGFQTEDGKNEKGALVNVSFNSPLYFARALDHWEKGNGWSAFGQNELTIEKWTEFLIKTRKAKFYLFDSPKELFDWLAE